MDEGRNISKQDIAAGYDAIVHKMGLETGFYDRCIAMHGSYSGKILDIGCGVGSLLKRVPRTSSQKLFGIDIAPKLIEEAGKANPDADVRVGDAEALPYESGMFDVVFMTEVLEHMLDFDKAVSELVRVLKPGGTAIVTVPNRDWASYDFYDKIRNKKMQPIDDHYFRFEEVRSLLERHALTIMRYKGSDNLYYYGWKHNLEMIAAFFLPFLHKKMKRLIFRCEKK